MGCTSRSNLIFEDSGSHNFDSKFILVSISVEFLVICSLYKPAYNAIGKVCTLVMSWIRVSSEFAACTLDTLGKIYGEICCFKQRV